MLYLYCFQLSFLNLADEPTPTIVPTPKYEHMNEGKLIPLITKIFEDPNTFALHWGIETNEMLSSVPEIQMAFRGETCKSFSTQSICAEVDQFFDIKGKPEAQFPRALILMTAVINTMNSANPSSILEYVSSDLLSHKLFNNPSISFEKKKLKFYRSLTYWDPRFEGSPGRLLYQGVDYQVMFCFESVSNPSTHSVILVLSKSLYEEFEMIANIDSPDADAPDVTENKQRKMPDNIFVTDPTRWQASIKGNQRCIGDELFARMCRLLCPTEHPSPKEYVRNKFKKVNFIIFVPAFNSLRVQTTDRFAKIADVLRENEKAEDFVKLCGAGNLVADDNSGLVDQIKAKLMCPGRPDELFVCVVDECHFASTKSKTSVHQLINDSELCQKQNFVVLMVSATPQNNLSSCTRIHENNIVHWEETLRKNELRPHYLGLDFYFSSVAFYLGGSEEERTLYVQESNKSASMRILIPNYRLFAQLGDLAHYINRRLKRLSIKINLEFIENKGFIFRAEGEYKLVDCSQNGLLHKLGFENNVVVNKNPISGRDVTDVTVDETSPLLAKRVRCDMSFTTFERKLREHCCSYLSEKMNRKGAIPISPFVVDEGPAALFEGLESCPRPQSTKEIFGAKRSLPLILDYVLSMAYFGSTRRDTSSQNALVLKPFDQKPEWDVCRESFVKMVYNSSFFNSSEGRHYDLRHTLVQALRIIFESVKTNGDQNDSSDDKKDGDSSDDEKESSIKKDVNDLCKEYLQFKFDAEKDEVQNGRAQEQSWFNETDRTVKMLLTERKPLAPMVVLRVVDTDDNKDMQTILRRAMTVSELFSRPNDGQSPRAPGFCILGDISNTQIFDSLGPYYQHVYTSTSLAGEDSTVEKRVEMSGSRKRAAVYEDLMNIPILVILCEKGRMGDTFPPSLRVMDLRVRSGGTLTCFVQELGRVCRYPWW